MSKARIGKKHTQETKDKIKDFNTGKTTPEKTKKKISKTMSGKVSNRKGAVLSDETKAKMGRASKGRKNPMKGKKTGKPAWNTGMTKAEEAIYRTLTKEERIQFRKNKE